MSYLAIYRALVKPPPEPVRIVKEPGYAVDLTPGPFTIRYQNFAPNPHSEGNVFDLEYQTREFDPGSYIVIIVPPTTSQHVIGAGWRIATDTFSRVVASLDLDFPGVVHEQLYEGTAATSRTPMFISREGGMDAGGRVFYPYGDVGASLRAAVDHWGHLPAGEAARFTLASRWFRRANDAQNPIDRVLFYYMVLEVYPTVHGSDVPRAVSELIAQRVYPDLSPQEVKARLDLGRICGFRGEIVHEGKANIDTFEEWMIVNGYVERLRAVARTCLRVLSGGSPGIELDRYVRPAPPASAT